MVLAIYHLSSPLDNPQALFSLVTMAPVIPHPPPVPPLPRTLILDYRDSYTNNLLSLFVALYPDEEVKRKVVVVQADEVDW